MGYKMTYEDEWGYKELIPEAYYIKCDMFIQAYENDIDARRAALEDGVKLITDIEGVPCGVYVDTPYNRSHILTMLDRFPGYRKKQYKLTSYAKAKIKVLEGFEITLSHEDMKRLEGLTSELSIDAFARTIIDKRL